MEKEQEQKPRPIQWEPQVAMGELFPVNKLPAGSYVCPTKGEAKRVYGDYRRIKMRSDFPREEEEKVASAPMKEFSDVGMLLPGAYVCPIKGEAKLVYGDYRRIGDPGTFH